MGVVILVATPPFARRKIAAAAEAQNLAIEVGSVRPGFFSVSLRDVRVGPKGETDISATFPEIRVGLSATLSPRRVEVHGGEIVVRGTVAELEPKIARWKAGRKPTDKPSKKDDREIVVDGLALAWSSADGSIDVKGASALVDAAELTLRAESVSAKRPEGEVVVAGAALELDEQKRLHRLRADTMTLVVAGKAAESAAPEPEPSAPPEPPPLPTLPPKKGEKTAKKPVVAEAAPFTEIVPFPPLEKVRARIAAATALVAEKLPEGSEVRLPALSVEVRGRTPFSVGPGNFSLLRGKDSVVVAFKSTGAEAGSTPLSIELLSPIAEGEPSLVLDGGPIPLSLLGLREGALGLVEVSRATLFAKGRVALDAKGASATFDGEVRLANASLHHEKLSRETLRSLTVGVAARGLVTSGALRLDDARLEVGTTHLGVHGSVEQDTTHLHANLAFDLPTVACQDLASSVPQGLMPTVRGMRFSGAFGARGRVAFDTKNLDALELEYAFDDRCRATEVPPAVARERFATVFTHTITHPDRSLGEARTGPGSGNWTDLGGISPYMPIAVLTTEDATFYRHHGFNHTAIKQSLVANVKARKFLRGASTITMQLAKNLFLVREKTLSRKLEEIVLANYLEQVFRKDDLMELYLNVVEFGPDVYGITQAAEHYFGRSPLDLSLGECLFLSSILPSPVRSHHLSDHGELPEHWKRHVQALMKIAEKTHRISPAELEDGLADNVVFHKAGTPRPPARATRRPRGDVDPDPDDTTDWHRLD